MRVLRFIGISISVIAGLLIATTAALWVLNPFAPTVIVLDPGAYGMRITDNGLLANFYSPSGVGKRPGILLLGGSEGGIGPGATRIARALQEHGYAVLQPSYFGAPGQPAKLEHVPLELFDRALDWLKAQSEVDGDRLGIVAASKGAEAALIVAARHPELRAVVAGMPSSVAWQGIDMNVMNMIVNPPGGSWALAGKPIPFVPYGQSKNFSGGIVEVYMAGLANLDKYQDAIIPIEKSHAAILLVCGRDDTLWPSCPMAGQVKQRAEANGGPAVTILAYGQAGHAVFGIPIESTNPNYITLHNLGGTDGGNNAARTDSWPKALLHLEAALK